MAEATAREQLILELMNRARMDPAGEAARFGISLNKDLAAGTISNAPKQVLAMNAGLNGAADAHSGWMLSSDRFSHTGIDGSDPGTRMRDAGYVFAGSWSWGENIAWSGTTGTLNPNAAAVQHHQNLFLSAGHRTNILNGFFREAGVGSLDGKFTSGSNTYNALMTTQNFATSGNDRFVTGVAYEDRDSNDFYSIGEARSGVTVDILQDGGIAASAVSGTAGGYAAAFASSAKAPVAVDVRFKGGGLDSPVGASVTLEGSNIKLDLVDGNTILSNVTAALIYRAVGLQLIGIEDADGTGNGFGNVLGGNAGDNRLAGLAGNDTLSGSGGDDILLGGGGNDRIAGGLGGDRLTGNAGSDVFVFASASDITGDLITDFAPGVDRIDLSGIDAVAGGRDNAFVFSGTGFAGAGSLRVMESGQRTLVQGDFDGNGIADFTLTLAGIKALTAADFIL
jgi:uncharacterized protein YkwD